MPIPVLKIDLWQHQKRMLDFAQSRPYSLIYAGFSTGKTIFALEYLRVLQGVKIIIAPKPALSVYLEDYIDHYLPNAFNLVIFDKGTVKAKCNTIQQALRANLDVIFVINYEVARALDLPKDDLKRITGVVFDEAHALGSYNSKVSLNLAKYFRFVPHKVAMTGTPYTDGYQKVYGITRALVPMIVQGKKYARNRLFGSWDDFLDVYCKTYNISRNIRAISGYKNLDELATILRDFTLIIKTEDVVDLPDKVTRVYSYELTGQMKQVYKELEKEGVVTIDDSMIFAPHILTRIIRTQQLLSTGVLTDVDGNTVEIDNSGRIEVLKNWLDDTQGLPIVIFTRFKKDIELINRVLADRGEVSAQLTGDIDTHEYWKQGKYRVLLVNMQAGGAGIRLQRSAHALFYTVGYEAGAFEQAHGRLRRQNNTAECVAFSYIIAKNTIDEQIYKTLRTKLDNEETLDNEILDNG